MGNLLSLQFWFDLRPAQLLTTFQTAFNAVILIFFAFFLIFLFLRKKKRGPYGPIFEKIYTFSLSNAFIGVLLWFFNYELIPFLAARFWFLIWGVSIAIWLWFIYKSLSKIPERMKKLAEESEFKKYMP